MAAYHLIIKGKVQGVFYRQSAQRQAIRLGLSGWIRNNADGAVECLVSGEEDQLQHFIDWCREGPTLARVTDIFIEATCEKPEGNFVILRS